MSHIALCFSGTARIQLYGIIGRRSFQLYSRARILRILKIPLGIAYRERTVRREHKVAHISQREALYPVVLSSGIVNTALLELERVSDDVEKPSCAFCVELSVICAHKIIRRCDITVDVSTVIHCFDSIESKQMEVACYSKRVSSVPHRLLIRRIDDRQSVSGVRSRS